MMRGRRCRLPQDADLLPRQVLLTAASRCPRLCDVGLTAPHRNCAGFTLRRPVPLGDHAGHALLLHVDGNGFSGRLDELLTLGAAVLKQASPFSAYYYPLLVAGRHYELLARNLSDLCDKARGLAAGLRNGGGGARAEQLAAAARRFTQSFLSPSAVTQYLVHLLEGYASLQRFVPRRHPFAVPWIGGDAADGKGVVGKREAPRPRSRPPPARGHGSWTPHHGHAKAKAGAAGGGRAACAGDEACCLRHPKACHASGAPAQDGVSAVPSGRSTPGGDRPADAAVQLIRRERHAHDHGPPPHG
jgi:hypothetical protein